MPAAAVYILLRHFDKSFQVHYTLFQLWYFTELLWNIHLYIYLYLSIYLSICLSIYLWIYLSIYLSIYLGRQYDTENIGLYRENRLSIFKNCSGLQIEKIKKRLQKIFKNNGLDVIIEYNVKIVNYLDVAFNLNDGTYRLYQNQIT